MTPARRRRITRIVLILCIVMLVSLAGRFWFLGQNLPSLLLGRKPGSADPGTVLVRLAPRNAEPNATPRFLLDPSLPPEAKSAIKLTFDKIGGWKYIEGKTPIPDSVKKLDGKWVEMTGFMWSNNQIQYLTDFIVVQSLWGCCFGKTPDMNHFLDVRMESGKVVEYYPDSVQVIGKLSVGEKRDERGYLLSLYRLEASMVVVQ